MEEHRPELLDRLQKQHPPLVEAILRLSQAISTLPSARAVLVGGFVRDLLLDQSPTDADIEVYGVEPKILESILSELFPNRINLVGQSFGVFKIHIDEHHELDIALPRRESKTGVGHKDFSIEGDPSLDPKEATRRRDFTINAILLDPLTGGLLDPWNGEQDLKDHTLRMVDPDHFGEDPLRVYRAIQFAARFSLSIEPQTKQLLTNMVAASELDHLPPERITEEWRKLLLKAEKPSIGLEIMRELRIIKKYYPELDLLIGVEQDPEWHPEGDVWIHTLMSVDAAAQIARRELFTPLEQLELVFGTLCHDLGKPSTTAVAPKQGVMRIRSLGHEEAGVEPTKQFCERLRFGKEIDHAALTAAKEHLKPGMLNRAAQKEGWTEEHYANAVRKLLKRIYPLSWRVLNAVSEADFRGRTLPESSLPGYPDGERLAETVIKHHLDGEALKPLLTGQDLLNLNVAPGPEIGRLIRIAEDARDRGEIKTKEEALKFVKRFIKKQ